MKYKLLIASLFASILSAQAHAATIQLDPFNRIEEINGVIIGTEVWDATFYDSYQLDTYEDAFALSATNALLDLFQNQYDGEAFDIDSSTHSAAWIFTATAITTASDGGVGIDAYYLHNDISITDDDGIGAALGFKPASTRQNAYVSWTQVFAVAPELPPTIPDVVPVPAAVWLFGSGLLGLVGVARRKVRS